MSFDVNVLSSKPVIKAAANMQNDGGGGNLGYMSQGQKEKKKKENTNIFAQKHEEDTFSFSEDYNNSKSGSNDFGKEVLGKLKELFS